MIPNLLDEFVSKKTKPSNAAFVRYLFFTMGFGEKEFNEMSLPYISEVLDTHHYMRKEEEKAHKKAMRKK